MMLEPNTNAARQSLASLSAENRKFAQELQSVLQRIHEGVHGPSPVAPGRDKPVSQSGLLADQQAIEAALRLCLQTASNLASDVTPPSNDPLRAMNANFDQR